MVTLTNLLLLRDARGQLIVDVGALTDRLAQALDVSMKLEAHSSAQR